jgi:hypothetical protein
MHESRCLYVHLYLFLFYTLIIPIPLCFESGRSRCVP